MPVRLNGSTSGYSELSAPAVAGNITLTLPTGTGSANQFLKNGATAGALAFGTTTEDASGNLAFNSGYGSAAVAYGCRAWVNFNGTGTVAIRASGNVSSITDNGTGDYTVNFTTALADANYCVTCTGEQGLNVGSLEVRSFQADNANTPTTTSVRLINKRTIVGGTTEDFDGSRLCVAIFR